MTEYCLQQEINLMCSKFFVRCCRESVQTSLKRFLRTLRQQRSPIMSSKRNCNVGFRFYRPSGGYRVCSGCRDRCWRMCLAINLQQAASSCHIKTFTNFPHKSTAIAWGVSEIVEATHFKFNAAVPLDRSRLILWSDQVFKKFFLHRFRKR